MSVVQMFKINRQNKDHEKAFIPEVSMTVGDTQKQHFHAIDQSLKP
jgi:hypothetical protein